MSQASPFHSADYSYILLQFLLMRFLSVEQEEGFPTATADFFFLSWADGSLLMLLILLTVLTVVTLRWVPTVLTVLTMLTMLTVAILQTTMHTELTCGGFGKGHFCFDNVVDFLLWSGRYYSIIYLAFKCDFFCNIQGSDMAAKKLNVLLNRKLYFRLWLNIKIVLYIV